ncbi:uncharacterized protein SPAPADRAFT_61716 [Spathaspora passalidarum NRRL Y-27907]|uniref:Uncharacterized protein n=1 Tax=Spathaspora passalidarum (strain NRRL Y-27907 / 11-Y1) TaxID=619300 RepID=G3AP79_SPAPN|nr:uncharacterized protein SPAPADRAFT_61716 [Spathaspora passalidarum NRRL Y-27907]EGW32650.1 hypothetical protein SPAPADRAFT_61716 [Spathaspora passalidarum NRRL Y-27907]
MYLEYSRFISAKFSQNSQQYAAVYFSYQGDTVNDLIAKLPNISIAPSLSRNFSNKSDNARLRLTTE